MGALFGAGEMEEEDGEAAGNISERESFDFNINIVNIKIIDDEQSSYEEK